MCIFRDFFVKLWYNPIEILLWGEFMENKIFYDLTNPQKSIWLTEQYFPNTSIGNVAGTLIFDSYVNFDVLEHSINLFIKKNDSFRLKFSLNGSEPVQYVEPYTSFTVPIVLVNDEDDVKKVEQDIVNTPFTILDSYLFKFSMFKFKNNKGGFIANVHHLISDAWTLGLLIDEIIEIYTSLIEESSFNLPTFSYIDYINSEQEYLSSEKFIQDKNFWKEIFTDVPEVAKLPSYSSLSNSSASKRVEYVFSRELQDRMNHFCAQNKISLYNFLMAIYSIYIGRVSNLDEFTIGTPLLNRSNYKEKHTTGMFVSTVPFKVSIESDCSFATFAKKVSESFFSIFRHQKYSYQSILHDLRKMDSDIPNLYDIALSYQNMRSNKQTSKISYFSRWISPSDISCGLNIHFFDVNDIGILNVAYDYQVSKYDESYMANMHERILFIINQVLNNSSILLKDIQIALNAEKFKILNEFNNSFLEYPSEETIVSLFESQVQKSPNQIAVCHNEDFLTYKELNEKVNSIANYLMSFNLNLNSAICVCMNKSIQFVATILAVQKIGCCYVPIHPSYPQDRIEYIISNSNSSFIITDHDMGINNEINLSKIDLSGYSVENINVPILPDYLAYIIYTSGSTGKPKGVMVSHGNLVNFLFAFRHCFENKFSSQDNCLSLTNISFDVSVCELFTPLVFGSSLVLYPENTLTDISLLCQLLEKFKITFLYIPPNVLLDVYKYIEKSQTPIYINKLLVGVEAIKTDTLNNFLSLNPAMEIINGYGPTETTICCTFYKYACRSCGGQIVPIGKPVSNNSIYILDKNMNIQPAFVPGELYVCGNNVTKGYLNNPEFTKNSYLYNVLNNHKISYRTGDMAYWDNSGIIHFIGRNDSQIKFRGHRIELGEINHAVKNIPCVDNAYTVLKSVQGSDCICTYVVTSEENIPLIKDSLKDFLPYYMVPSYIIPIQTIPLTLNGKVDKSKLPEFVVKNTDAFEAPATKLELDLSSILENILHHGNISVTSNLFELGADSLCLIRFASDIYNVLGFKVTVKDIFECKTIRELSKFIEECLSTETVEKISRAPLSDSYPLSSAQKRIFLSTHMANEQFGIYNTPGAVLLDNIPDIDKLNYCFKQLIARHESFRTYFVTEKHTLVQKVAPSVDFNIETEKNTTDSLEDIYHEFIRPFDLSCAPLLRCKLVELGNKKALLLLDMHHIISDGSSLKILIDELCKLYNDEHLSEISFTYKDFAVWEENILASNKLEKSKKFWLEQFEDGVPVLNMPTDYPKPLSMSFKGNKFYMNLSHELSEKIYELSKRLNVTPYMLLLSAYYILLSRYSGQTDIVVGSPSAGRSKKEFENVIGMFVNSLPLRCQLDLNSSFETFIAQIKNLCLKAYEHQDYPFDLLVKDLKLKREAGNNPIFDTTFTYQNDGNLPINLGDIHSSYCDLNSGISKFALSIEVTPNDSHFSLCFEYSTDLFSSNYIERFANHYSNLLFSIVTNSKLSLKDMKLLSEDELKEILYNFNDTSVPYPREKSIIELFEEQVEKNPHKTAIVYENQKFTYEELNLKSNQLAHFLKKSGVSENSIVSLFLDKSLEMVIGFLAILKINCCILPIDINFPAERISFIIRNSNSAIMLTQKNILGRLTVPMQTICIDLDNDNIYSSDKWYNLNLQYSAESPSYLMYTSGSTGNPKGVLLSNRNVVRLVKNINYIKFREEERILQVATVVFDACIFETWTALLNGFSLHLIKKESLLDISEFEEYLSSHKITILLLTSALFNQMAEEKPSIFENVYTLLVGGDVLSPQHINKVKTSCPNLKIVNAYGPTENGTISTFFEVDKLYENSIPIGSPITNSTAYVVDNFGNLQGIDMPGELYVGGDGVASGYFNNPSLTAEKFVSNYFSQEGMLYKTGDLAKWLPDGSLEFLGRIDSQVKIRGYRIELKEIENRILKFDGIKECFVTDFKNGNDKFLCAYFVSDFPIDISVLKSYLSELLPSYMLPRFYVQLDALPLTINGKINRNQLPKNFDVLTEIPISVAKTEMQKRLLSIWQSILGISEIDIHENFFDLGGDSLAAMRLQIDCVKHGLKVSYADIFKYPTIAEMASTLEKQHDDEYIKDTRKEKYLKYTGLLYKNSISSVSSPVSTPVGNLLLTGFTGFLGAHILDSFLKMESGNIYCLIRDKDSRKAEDRLLEILQFYFGEKYLPLINKRIFLVKGDISEENFGLSSFDYDALGTNVDTVIHSAALVKHFGEWSSFEKVNVNGTKNIVDFCLKYNKKLLHISTISVSGNALAEQSNVQQDFSDIRKFSEQNFYIGQNLDNYYIKSKFLAEEIVFDAILNQNLSAYVVRMGNLTSRFSEGRFQYNHFENAFVNRFKSIFQVGYIPDYLLDIYVEFTPIDYCGNAIIKLAQFFNKDYSVFHLLNEKHVTMRRLYSIITDLGISLNIVPDKEFQKIISNILKDESKKLSLSGIIDDFDANKKLSYQSNIEIKSDFSKDYLASIGFEWPYIDAKYIKNYLKYLSDIGYFPISLN